jgi:N-formylglutamate amidohydrolase
MILHIPHSSRAIPEELRDQIVLADDELLAELNLMTDGFTDKLFNYPESSAVSFPISRLLIDVERFSDDNEEPMSKVGMGVIYTHTAHGEELRRILHQDEKKHLIANYYDCHHQVLSLEVEKEMGKYGNALIIDCHSFPSRPLPCDNDQSLTRPDFCIGTDFFHTPEALMLMTRLRIAKMGYSVGINRPYSGSLVPRRFYRKDRCVMSIMIEVNRRLYMDEMSGNKNDRFDQTRDSVISILKVISKFQQQAF